MQSSDAFDLPLVQPVNVRKRDGKTTQPFDVGKIEKAVKKAWLEAEGSVDEDELARVSMFVAATIRAEVADVEEIQDAVEIALMRAKKYKVAKAYILYRERRADARRERLQPDKVAVSDYIHASKYARYVPDLLRREVYDETVERCESMHLRRFGHLEGMKAMIARAFDLVRAKRVLPSMRSMQFGGAAIEANHNRIYNCSATLVDRPRAFAEAMFLLLSGCGVGYSIQYDHVEKLPPIAFVDPKRVEHHVVQDTIEGWADALDALINGYIAGVHVEFAYHLIRSAGTPLKTSGGRAPGHRTLKESLECVRKVLDNAQGRQLRPIDCHRIMCHAADAVLSGGIRRSAMICLFSLEDSEMMNIKSERDWFKREPWLQNANNSAVLKRDEVKEKQFKRIFKSTRYYGEPGFLFVDDYDHVTNPCFAPNTRLWTTEGYKKIVDLYNEGYAVNVVADNRIGAGDAVSPEVSGVKVRAATRVALTQASAEVFKLTTEHGYHVTMTANHKIPTARGRIELRDVVPGDVLYLPSGEGTFGTKGSHSEGLLVGMFTGDGAIAARSAVHESEAFVDLWQDDFDLLPSVENAMNQVINTFPSARRDRVGWYARSRSEGGIESKRIGGVRFFRWLSHIADHEQVESLKTRVPETVWQGSREFVAGYLAGLFISDGTVGYTNRGTKTTITLRLTQANRALLEDVQVLLSMFGVVSRLYSRRPAGMRMLPDGNGGRAEYMCEEMFELIINRPNLVRFEQRIGLQGRKAQMITDVLDRHGRECRKEERYITRVLSVEPAGTTDVYCLTQPETNCVTSNGIVNGQCAEIGLDPVLVLPDGTKKTGWAMCNLCEINAAKLTSLADFKEAAWAATLIGTMQATYTDMPYLGEVTEQIVRRDALLGVGMTGMQDAPHIACSPDFQRDVAGLCVAWNREYAKLFGINPAARVTCVKPSGTTTLALGSCGSGIHPHHARRYIRRVTADELEVVFQAFKAMNPHMCVQKPDGKWVIEFPVEAPDSATLKEDLTALQFMDIVRSTQQNWVLPGTTRESEQPGLRHNVSNTITVRDGEWDQVADYLWAHRYSFTGVSLLGDDGDVVYPFAPFEAVRTEAQERRWNELVAGYAPVDYYSVFEAEDGTNLSGEAACAGGACSIV